MNKKWKSISCVTCGVLPKSLDDIEYIKTKALCYDCYSVAKIKNLNLDDESEYLKILKIVKNDDETQSRIILNNKLDKLTIH